MSRSGVPRARSHGVSAPLQRRRPVGRVARESAPARRRAGRAPPAGRAARGRSEGRGASGSPRIHRTLNSTLLPVAYISTVAEIKRGRRPGPSTTRDAILAAARERFSEHGYDRVRMRDVAADAGVDVALVTYHFGSKDGLFAAALEMPAPMAALMADVLEHGEHRRLRRALPAARARGLGRRAHRRRARRARALGDEPSARRRGGCARSSRPSCSRASRSGWTRPTPASAPPCSAPS